MAAGVVVAIVMTIIKPNFNKITSAAGINSTNVTNWINSVRGEGIWPEGG